MQSLTPPVDNIGYDWSTRPAPIVCAQAADSDGMESLQHTIEHVRVVLDQLVLIVVELERIVAAVRRV